MVNVEIDGIQVRARDGALIIEAADDAGIPIPRFCYHKKLSIAANCRMCLVEVEKAAKPLPACATPVTEGMKVLTRSPRALDAQKGTMEFLLINHPLDCPICDQGGECDLQEMAMGYGGDHSRFTEGKRVIRDKNLGPLIATDMTRCIHCTRCVRFGDEIAGIKELGATGRGEHMEIGTYVQHAVTSELSGNVIDLCPVGALTSKPFRYTARPWELIAQSGVAPHDCVGSNIYYHVRRGDVMRVLPRENESINETWISDRDRFSYTAIDHPDRLLRPRLKENGEWREVDWETALHAAVEGVKAAMMKGGAGQLGALASPSATVEELYLLQKLARALGSNNVDHRLREQDTRDQDAAPVYPSLGLSIEALESLNSALIVGGNVRKDQPLLGHRLRKAALKGADLLFVNPVDYDFRFRVAGKIIASPAGMEHALAGIAKALAAQAGPTGGAEALLAAVHVEPAHQAIADRLRSGEHRAVLLGSVAQAMPNYSRLRALASLIARSSGAEFGVLTEGANAAGAWIAGAVPHRVAGGKASGAAGLSACEMIGQGLRSYMLLGVEPEFDFADSGLALEKLGAADCVVAITPYWSEGLARVAHVVLPAAAFAETSGSYVNVEGRWQSFEGAVPAPGEARPIWKILRVLGNLFGLAGFDYMSSSEVRDEARSHVKGLELAPAKWPAPGALTAQTPGVVRLADVPIYAVDALVRRAVPLQDTTDAVEARAVRVNARTAASLSLAGAERVTVTQGQGRVTLPLMIDERVPTHAAWVPAGIAPTAGLGAYGTVIEITRG